MLGGAGNDFIVAGADAARGLRRRRRRLHPRRPRTTERILGNEGNDWIEGGTFDGAARRQLRPDLRPRQIIGHDVFIGDGSTDEYIGEGGDDIMVGGAGIERNEGMSASTGRPTRTTRQVGDGSPVSTPTCCSTPSTSSRCRRRCRRSTSTERRGPVGLGLQRHARRLRRDRRRDRGMPASKATTAACSTPKASR